MGKPRLHGLRTVDIDPTAPVQNIEIKVINAYKIQGKKKIVLIYQQKAIPNYASLAEFIQYPQKDFIYVLIN